MGNIRVLVVDDNDELRELMTDYLGKQPGISVIGAADSGTSAVKTLTEERIDVMLLDMIMPGMDGFGVLAYMQKYVPQEKHPRVIAVTALGRDDFIQRAVEMGVTYYMVKPVDMQILVERVRDTHKVSPSGTGEIRSVVNTNMSLDDKLSNLFLTMGIPAHIKGYQFLREAVKLVIENPPIIGGITKELYPAIARRFATSPSKVERAIRHAIEVAWSRGRVETLNQAFGCLVAQPELKPTNGEFIALVADKMLLEQQSAS